MSLNKFLQVNAVRELHVILIVCLFVISLLFITIRLINLTIFQGPMFLNCYFPASDNKINRFNIVDRDGLFLATSVTTASLYINSQLIINKKKIVQSLLKVLPELDEHIILKQLSIKKPFVWLFRHLTPKQQEKILGLGEPSLNFLRDKRHFYPYGSLCAHVLGITDVDSKGVAGFEKTFNINNSGIQDNIFQDRTIQTSLNISIQSILHDQLVWAMEKFRAESSNSLVMDLKTSEILAIVSLPDFNLNLIDKLFLKEVYFNRNTLGVYEMGSTLKILNTALALEIGTINLESLYNTTRSLKINCFNVMDFYGIRQWFTVSAAFTNSSNIASGQIALDLGFVAQKAFVKSLGLLDSIFLEVPEVSLPISPINWSRSNVITISYGYGLSVSSLHLASAVSKVITPDGASEPTLLYNSSSINKRIRGVSQKTSTRIRKLMRYVIVSGKSNKSNVNGYIVCGKTGTSMIIKNGFYQEGCVITSFIGVVGLSLDSPRYLIFVMLDKPKPIKDTFGYNTAGWNAAPLAGRIMRNILSLGFLR